MNETYSIGLSLLDFLPNIAFLVGAYYLVRVSALVKGVKCSRMVMAGALLIALGGILKASWKFIFVSTSHNIPVMGEVQFILVAPGFFALLISAILLAGKTTRQKYAPMLAIAGWKIPFLFIMTITSLGAHGILAYISFQRKAIHAAIGFIIAFVGLLTMGGLASAEQTVRMQWFEEGINSFGQIGFAFGSFFLHKDFSNPAKIEKKVCDE